MTRDKLVVALGVLLKDVADEGYLAFPMDVAARFVARHRLVSLPEEPNGWCVEWKGDISTDEAPKLGLPHPSVEAAQFIARGDGYATGRIVPVRTVMIPGDPIDILPAPTEEATDDA